MIRKKIKVAYILTPITFGGAEKVSLNYLRTVDRDRFDIRPILLTRPWEEEPYFAGEIQRYGYSYETVPVALRPLTKGRDRLRLPRVAYRLHSIFKKESFDVVHTHGYFADTCGLPMARILGICNISTCHGFVPNDRKLKFYNRLDLYILRLCNTIIAVSEGIKLELVRYGVRASNIVVIPNAVTSALKEDDLRFHRQEYRRNLDIGLDDFVVGYVGRLSQEKGVNFLIQAVEKLRDADIPVKLLIIGDGPEKTTLVGMVRDKRLADLITFTGFQADIEKWLSTLDVFTLPSLTEGTPMALLEAMGTGLPSIATAVGGVPNIITDGLNGFLVPAKNHHVFYEKIRTLIENPSLRAQIGATAYITIQRNYGIHSWCRSIERLYLKII